MNEATRQFIEDHLCDDVHKLALRKAPSGVDLTLALTQIEARQILSKKAPSWADNNELLFPPHISIEQCSSEATAVYKASLLSGEVLTDLTGGLGIDTFFMSRNFEHTNYVECQEHLCAIARHNFGILGRKIEVWHDEAESFLTHCGRGSCIFIDPARRDIYGRKTISITDCSPDVAVLQEKLLEHSPLVLIKLSPMLDIAQGLTAFNNIREVHIVAVNNECKELLFLLDVNHEGEPQFCCANLGKKNNIDTFLRSTEDSTTPSYCPTPMTYLYEPNAALMKGGFFKSLGARYNVKKLHPNSHLYTSDTLITCFPGRIFEVLGYETWNKRTKTTLLYDVKKASIATRNFHISAVELRKKLQIADGEEHYLFATTLLHNEKVIIKTKKHQP